MDNKFHLTDENNLQLIIDLADKHSVEELKQLEKQNNELQQAYNFANQLKELRAQYDDYYGIHDTVIKVMQSLKKHSLDALNSNKTDNNNYHAYEVTVTSNADDEINTEWDNSHYANALLSVANSRADFAIHFDNYVEISANNLDIVEQEKDKTLPLGLIESLTTSSEVGMSYINKIDVMVDDKSYKLEQSDFLEKMLSLNPLINNQFLAVLLLDYVGSPIREQMSIDKVTEFNFEFDLVESYKEENKGQKNKLKIS